MRQRLGSGLRAGAFLPALGALGIIFLFLLLRWNNYNAPLIRDEGEYAYAAQLLRHSLMPYQDAFLQKPPMIVYTYLLSNLAAPAVFWFPRILAALFIGAATGLLGDIARREFGPGVALPAMALFTPMVLLPGIEQFHANTEMFLLLPLLGAVAVYSRRHEDGGGFSAWFVAGLLGAAAFWYKYTCLPLLILLFAYWSWQSRRLPLPGRTRRKEPSMNGLSPKADWTRDSLRRVLQSSLAPRWAGALLGALAASLAALGLFLLRDGGQHLWECTVRFNRFYAQSNNFAWDLFSSRLSWFWSNWWVLFLLLPALALAWTARLRFWLAMFLVAWLTTNGSGYGQYYLLIMPFWALLAAVALRGLGKRLAARIAWPESRAQLLLTLVALGLVCWPDLHFVTLSHEAFAREKFAGSNPFLESALVAKRVEELTQPNDYVLVAGSEPQILVYSHRFSPTRFIITAPLMIPSPLAAGFQQETIEALREHPPAVIVLARANSSWLMEENSPREFPQFLYQLLNEKYQQLGGYIPDAADGRWEEPMPHDALNHSSLLLFRRARQH